MLKNITPPHISAADEKTQIAQIKRYLQTLSRDLAVILSDLERRLPDEDGEGKPSE